MLSAQFQSTTNTTFTVDQDDLFVGGGIQGFFGTDTLKIHGTSMDLRNTVMASIEILTTDSSEGTTFALDQFDILGVQSVVGHTSGNDTLATGSTELNITSVTLDSIEALKAGTSVATTFTVDQSDLAIGGSVIGGTGTDTLIGHYGTAFDLSNTTLTSIEVIRNDNGGGTTFTVDQADLAAGGSVIGNSGTDTLVTTGTGVDLTSTTLSSIEVIESAIPANATLFTIGGGQGGVTLELTANGKADTIGLTSACKVTDVTNDASILAHILSINNFTDGAGGDVLDVSSLTKGAPVQSVDITGFLDLAHPSSLKEALDYAAIDDGSTTSIVATFQYGGNSFVVIDRSASDSLTSDDAVIEVVGIHAFDDASNFIL